MKTLTILLCCMACLSLGYGQSIVGTWYSEWENEAGEAVNMTANIKADNTYALDFMSDGQVDITGKYKMDGEQITIQDDPSDAEDSCSGTGVYKAQISDDAVVMTRVSDECEGRGGPEGVMKMSRK